MTIDPDDEKVAAAFASLKAESAAHFPPPPVNELIMRGPAALRRRRLLSLAAVVGACTAVTAGGFAVAQTLGPLTGGPDAATTSSAVVDSAEPEGDGTTRLGDPASPDTNEGESPTDEATVPPETTLVITDPGELSDACTAADLGLDMETWRFTSETPWSVALGAMEPVFADVTGDGEDDLLLAFECFPEEGDAFHAGIAAFEWNEDGTALEQLGWVWEPYTIHAIASVASVEEGVVTVDAVTDGDPERTGAFRYQWDGEAFVPVEDDATAEPTETATSESPLPGETPTTAETTPSASSGS